MAPYEALYGRKCRSPLYWDEVGERKLLGPDLVQQTVNLVRDIRENMRVAQNRQQSYANNRRRDLEFEVGSLVFLKVAPFKGILRFGNRGKLSPRYIGPFEILEKIGSRAYRLALPPNLSRIHNVFHISMLRKYIPSPEHVLKAEPIELNPNLSYEEKPLRILDSKTKTLRNREIHLVKVQWHNHTPEEATWVRESEMRSLYPELFGTGTSTTHSTGLD
ncbi:PREDICTED: uncharacterized protein LOC105965854 [Erythranthe guttata]|uniref:uncharacterized protein LOC105965854 n=1 Tax=Erythranthe guttata TaxID=4155 RepID=UPI00064D9FC6|nr:PREDICTED: uncharacterized protein LOC105965854 [Erythranthe guttata]|eukprot:XP_012845856.1 PREDICTED: uncharacterized protein LOC105965854 [Erythranthe guttata]